MAVIRPLCVAVVTLLASLIAGPARADDTASSGAFTPAQRAEIVQIVRQALKSDPTILADAIASLRAQADTDAAASQQSVLAAHQAQLDNTPGDAVAGNPHGSRTLYEFYDPRCPWCRRMVGDVEALPHTHPDLRIVLKLIAILGPQSTLDGRAILAAANQNAYLPMQHALMTDQTSPGPDRIRRIALGLHLDADRLAADMDSPTITAELDAERTLAATLRIDGTPSFIIGTHVAPGAMSAADLDKFVDTKG